MKHKKAVRAVVALFIMAGVVVVAATFGNASRKAEEAAASGQSSTAQSKADTSTGQPSASESTQRTTSEQTAATAPEKAYLLQGKQFKVEGSDSERSYRYSIYDAKGRVVDEGQVERMAPEISYISENVMKICFHGGTYADLCKYYDTKNNVFSQDYWNPFLEQAGLIVYYDADDGGLVVRDIFDKSKFYRTYSRDMSLTSPPEAIAFFDNGRKLRVSYVTKEQEPVSEVFDLGARKGG